MSFGRHNLGPVIARKQGKGQSKRRYGFVFPEAEAVLFHLSLLVLGTQKVSNANYSLTKCSLQNSFLCMVDCRIVVCNCFSHSL